jgi:ATP-dependent RNA helicase DDX3X
MSDSHTRSESKGGAINHTGISGWSQPEAYDYSNYESNHEQRRDWDGNARIYEWDGEHGDVGPEFPELEIELFGPPEDRKQVKGIDFSK